MNIAQLAYMAATRIARKQLEHVAATTVANVVCSKLVRRQFEIARLQAQVHIVTTYLN